MAVPTGAYVSIPVIVKLQQGREEKCGTLSGPRELLDFFPPVPRNLASPAKSAPTNNLKNFLYFTSKCLVGITFLSAIQAGSQSKDTSWTVLSGVDFNDRRPAWRNLLHVGKGIREKHMSSVSLTVPPNLLIFSTCILCCALTSILVIK